MHVCGIVFIWHQRSLRDLSSYFGVKHSCASIFDFTDFLCVSVFACVSCLVPISPLQSIWKIFFFFVFILRGHGWFVSAWHSDASIRTPPSHVNTVCDLLAKSLTTPSHYWPSSRLFYLTPSFVFLSPIYLRQTLSFSAFVSSTMAMHRASPPPCLISDAHKDTHTHTHTHTHCTCSQDGITHSSALTSLTFSDHWRLAVCAAASVGLRVRLYKCGCEVRLDNWQGWALICKYSKEIL